ncbi:MAG: exopolysaccharide biosynthesis polyprenyl glycosylphosphotransferase [Candidatus Omnitrophota bacterium]|nr:exopolysaccharide biosynthesis polyprenyl glycosylphosphotransferase [Candidatus Omnitrophota bacterium]
MTGKSRHKNNKLDTSLLFLFDVLAFVLSLGISVRAFCGDSLGFFVVEHMALIFHMALVTFLSFYFFDLYYVLKDFRRYRQTINLLLAAGMSFFLTVIIAFWDKDFIYRKLFTSVFFLFLFVFAFFGRVIFSIARVRLFRRKAVIIGNTPMGRLLQKYINKKEKEGSDFGIEIAGYISDDADTTKETYSGLPHLGRYADLKSVLDSQNISLLVYALDDQGASRLNEVIIQEKLKGTNLISAVALYEAISGMVPYEHINSAWLIEDCLRGNKFAEVRLKRAVDIVLGTSMLLISLPCIALLALLVKLGSGGPALFVQTRAGRFEKPFKMFKLRTMRLVDDKEFPKDPEGWHAKNIGRVSPLGKVMRKFHLDELPQFYNVIIGDMSIVGPRPEMQMFIEHCEERIPFYKMRLAVRPGITGWAQVWYTHTSTLRGYKSKFKYDLYYLANLSLRMDLEIMLRTVLRIFGYPKVKQDKAWP